MSNATNSSDKIRLDKWLWAARFFKTRSIAKQAIEGGKVHYNGQRCKVSKEVELNAKLTIRQGWDEKEVIVTGLSSQRRGADEARQLYRETQQSVDRRESAANDRRALRGLGLERSERPNKKQRRQIHRFKQQDES